MFLIIMREHIQSIGCDGDDRIQHFTEFPLCLGTEFHLIFHAFSGSVCHVFRMIADSFNIIDYMEQTADALLSSVGMVVWFTFTR